MGKQTGLSMVSCVPFARIGPGSSGSIPEGLLELKSVLSPMRSRTSVCRPHPDPAAPNCLHAALPWSLGGRTAGMLTGFEPGVLKFAGFAAVRGFALAPTKGIVKFDEATVIQGVVGGGLGGFRVGRWRRLPRNQAVGAQISQTPDDNQRGILKGPSRETLTS